MPFCLLLGRTSDCRGTNIKERLFAEVSCEREFNNCAFVFLYGFPLYLNFCAPASDTMWCIFFKACQLNSGIYTIKDCKNCSTLILQTINRGNKMNDFKR